MKEIANAECRTTDCSDRLQLHENSERMQILNLEKEKTVRMERILVSNAEQFV